MPSRRRRLAPLHLSVALLATACLTSCSTSYPRRDPTGELFPTVQGNALSGGSVVLPRAVAGEPAVLLVGFEQETQFDLDRWLLGIAQLELRVRVLEVPAIPGVLPGLFSGSIDAGMRRGIPEEDQASVVTLYDDAAAVARFTGNEDPLPGRVLLLDDSGRVVFFHDRGYSVGTLMRMKAALQRLREATPPAG